MILAKCFTIMKRSKNHHWPRWWTVRIAVFMAIAPIMLYSAPAGANEALCDAATRNQERVSKIPSRLLYAIASVESGRWDAETKANIAWPWTVTSLGEGKFYPTRQEAIQAVKTLIGNGVTNIDVGCMQINLGYHPDAFETLHEAFEPETNVAYAATFLNDLRKTRRSWSRAVRFYHSSDTKRQAYYGKKVYGAWQQIRIRDRKVHIAERKKRVDAKRQARIATPEPTDDNAAGSSVQFGKGTTWPPRDYRQQRQMQMNARAWAFSPK